MASYRIVGYCRLQQLKMNFFNPYHCESGPYVYPEFLMNNLASTSGVGYQHQDSSPTPPPPPPHPLDQKPVKPSISHCCVFNLIVQKKKRTRKHSELASVACCVCGFTAGPHNYYGARVRIHKCTFIHDFISPPQACIPCRAFFRRSVEEQLFGAYVCYRTKDWDVKRTGRKSCKYCRFQVCIIIVDK